MTLARLSQGLLKIKLSGTVDQELKIYESYTRLSRMVKILQCHRLEALLGAWFNLAISSFNFFHHEILGFKS